MGVYLAKKGCEAYNSYQNNKNAEQNQKFIKNCQKENPALYKRLQEAEKELAKLLNNNPELGISINESLDEYYNK